MVGKQDTTRDVFICHTSADKESVVRPLVELLEANGISCWLDESQILWGDSLIAKVNEGLSASRYVIVVLSVNFLHKHWPERELNSSLNIEATTGKTRVLPLLVGSDSERKQIVDQYPLLNDKAHMVWPRDKSSMLSDINSLLGRRDAETEAVPAAPSPDIRLPELKRNPSEFDRHQFLKAGYDEIRNFFHTGLGEVERSDEAVITEFIDVSASKFICTVFVDGEKRTNCKIWIGGFSNEEQILYSSSFDQIDNDNSYNEWLTVSRSQLGWDTGGMANVTGQATKGMTHAEVAEYLWEIFIRSLE